MKIEDDLLPGDEDAILDGLERTDRTAKASEAFMGQLAAFLKHEDFMASVKGFASGGIFNSSTKLPVIPFEPRDEAIIPTRYLDGYGVKLMRPEHTIRITNIA